MDVKVHDNDRTNKKEDNVYQKDANCENGFFGIIASTRGISSFFGKVVFDACFGNSSITRNVKGQNDIRIGQEYKRDINLHNKRNGISMYETKDTFIFCEHIEKHNKKW